MSMHTYVEGSITEEHRYLSNLKMKGTRFCGICALQRQSLWCGPRSAELAQNYLRGLSVLTNVRLDFLKEELTVH
jgi:hypothetical protein